MADFFTRHAPGFGEEDGLSPPAGPFVDRVMRLTLSIALMLALCGSAKAEADCASIVDRTQRLACYDATAAPKPPVVEAVVTEEMSALRREIQKSMLEAGVNIEVTIGKKDFIQPAGPYPSLIIFGNMTRVDVYQIAKSIDVVNRAKAVGFKSIEFANRTNDRWRFDLTAAGPPCAREICL